MKLTQLVLCAAAIALPLSSHAASQKSNDRWFEVEIILFSQLGDKTQLKENFPDTTDLPKYRYAEDLLGKYLNPDIRGLKQLLPSCDSPAAPQSLLEQHAKLPPLFAKKSLKQILQFAESKNNSTDLTAPNKNFSDASNDVTSATIDNRLVSRKTTPDQANNPVTENEALSSGKISAEVVSNAIDNPLEPSSVELSQEQRIKIQQSVQAAEEEFQQLKFQYTAKKEAKSFCRIDQSYFADYQASHPTFDYYGFTVDKIPLRIDSPEEIGNNNTHLLSNASLKLGDIITDLRYSKDFRPLLHMGWRQVARPKKQSVPVKVYAGENFEADHQKKLADFKALKNQHTRQLLAYTNQQDSVTSLAEKVPNEQSKVEQLQLAKQARIEQIISQLSQVKQDSDELFTSIDKQDLSLELANKNIIAPRQLVQPQPPIQQWFLDGFFNIHLKHYLFITADFTVLDKNLSELASAELANSMVTAADNNTVIAPTTQAKAIRFKQDRRVISGEVHYFDHPYMGMIVQIRPYTKPEPEAEL